MRQQVTRYKLSKSMAHYTKYQLTCGLTPAARCFRGFAATETWVMTSSQEFSRILKFCIFSYGIEMRSSRCTTFRW